MQEHGHPDQSSRGKPRRNRHTNRQEQERHHPDEGSECKPSRDQVTMSW